MKTNKIIIFFLSSVLLLAGFSFFSCKRPSKPKAVVIVVDETGKVVEEAKVVIVSDTRNFVDTSVAPRGNYLVYFSNGPKYSDTSLTDASGQISYEFMYEAIYNVKCSKILKKNPLTVLSGSGVLILKENETCSETVKIRLGTN